MANTEIVGILNLTPDSFSDGGKFVNSPIARAEKLFHQGASIIDIGAESTRPGATPITASQELHRLNPAFTHLVRRFAGKISLDTRNPETVSTIADSLPIRIAKRLIINDVSMFSNPQMIETAAKLGCLCIVSHLPEYVDGNIQAAHGADQKVDSLDQVLSELMTKRNQMTQAGIRASNIILDPGIGFGKTASLNRKLLAFANATNHDVMIGYSRKRFLGEDRMKLAPNLAAAKIAITSGARYIRVHDVEAHAKLLAEYSR